MFLQLTTQFSRLEQIPRAETNVFRSFRSNNSPVRKRVIHTKLTPLENVAKSIGERVANVVSYCTHGITNAVAEGMNSKIMSTKRRVGGYRNRESFKTAIDFYCGGLDLYSR